MVWGGVDMKAEVYVPVSKKWGKNHKMTLTPFYLLCLNKNFYNLSEATDLLHINLQFRSPQK